MRNKINTLFRKLNFRTDSQEKINSNVLSGTKDVQCIGQNNLSVIYIIRIFSKSNETDYLPFKKRKYNFKIPI